jgi:hypothetical protein
MTQKAIRPKLFVIAGPNGIGKIYADLKLYEWGEMRIEELAKPVRYALELE